MKTHLRRSLALALTLTTAAAIAVSGAAPRFYPDDPLVREPDTRDAKDAKPWDIDLTWDLAYNLFANPGDPAKNVRAQNVNTIDEVPDSNWFTNRILARPVSIDEAVKGPITGDGPAAPKWTIIRPKQAGAAPGFTMKDSKGIVWFVSFDSKDHPEAATSAIIVANKIFWTLGYWQVENHLISIHPEDLEIDETATIKLANGKRRSMRKSDLDDVLRRSERSANGAYRAVAGRGLPGKILGGFRYVGTRPDDPNDVIPHEHRRELRALKVFGAWTNLTDMKAGNTLDTIIEEGGKSVVRHYLQDVGSTFGTGAVVPHEYDEGWEYLFEGDPLMKRLMSVGLYRRPWQIAEYDDLPAIGRFEAEAFDPTEWKPRTPTAAFVRARPDDNFWAARRVMAFSDDLIRAIVKTGQFSDPAAEKLLADTLITRRDKIGQAYLTGVNPLVNFALDNSGTLTFESAAPGSFDALLSALAGYKAAWSVFDNLTHEVTPIGGTTEAALTVILESRMDGAVRRGPARESQPQGRTQAPAALPTQETSFVRVQLTIAAPVLAGRYPPVTAYFRREQGNWKLVGLEREERSR